MSPLLNQGDRADSGPEAAERGVADDGRPPGARHLRHGTRRHRKDKGTKELEVATLF